MNTEWLVWQLADSAFPSGGFAHSGGLEATWKHGEITCDQDLLVFLQASLAQTGQSTVPFLNAAHRDPGRFRSIDQRCEAFVRNHVASRASQRKGQALLLTARAICDGRTLAAMRQTLAAGGIHAHLPVVFGVLTRELDVEHAQAVGLLLFATLRDLVGSAIRLGLVGPMRGQTIQRRLAPYAGDVADRCASLALDDAAQSAPLLDIHQGAHDRLYSRLFQT